MREIEEKRNMGDVNDQHEHLKNLIEKSSIPWTYAILWECSSQRRVLRFKDGYHRGSGKAKQVRIMGSGGTVAEDTTDYDAATEWFFKMSMNQYFEINEDLPGHALIISTAVWINAQDKEADPRYKWGMWERTKWAHQFGIRTFLCFPLEDKRVLELTSTQIIPPDIQWMLHNVHLIRHIGTLTQQQQLLIAQQQVLRLFPEQHVLRRNDAQQLLARRDNADELNEEPDEEAVNELKNRGKEKISDSKCSWTILTESSDRGIDTFSCSHDYSGPSSSYHV